MSGPVPSCAASDTHAGDTIHRPTNRSSSAHARGRQRRRGPCRLTMASVAPKDSWKDRMSRLVGHSDRITSAASPRELVTSPRRPTARPIMMMPAITEERTTGACRSVTKAYNTRTAVVARYAGVGGKRSSRKAVKKNSATRPTCRPLMMRAWASPVARKRAATSAGIECLSPRSMPCSRPAGAPDRCAPRARRPDCGPVARATGDSAVAADRHRPRLRPVDGE